MCDDFVWRVNPDHESVYKGLRNREFGYAHLKDSFAATKEFKYRFIQKAVVLFSAFALPLAVWAYSNFFSVIVLNGQTVFPISPWFIEAIILFFVLLLPFILVRLSLGDIKFMQLLKNPEKIRPFLQDPSSALALYQGMIKLEL